MRRLLLGAAALLLAGVAAAPLQALGRLVSGANPASGVSIVPATAAMTGGALRVNLQDLSDLGDLALIGLQWTTMTSSFEGVQYMKAGGDKLAMIACGSKGLNVKVYGY